MNTAIKINNLVKTYDGTEAVKGISFDIQEGEFFGFLGQNGAGKTTTINCIVGLANVTGGSIEVFGKDVVKNYKEARPLIGLAAQEPNFDPFFPLHTVLTYQAGYHGMPRSEAKQRAEKLLKRFDLWEHRDKTPRQISGGMKRRLLIAKALIHDPKVLIMDEPTAGVDVELRRDMWQFLRELNNEGKTILLTTHYIEEAEELCNRIGIIHQGQMREIEDKHVLMEKLAEKSVLMTVEHLSDAAREAIGKQQHVTIDGNVLRFDSEDIDKHLQTVSEFVAAHELKIVDINVTSYDLEDIFIQLTK